MWRSSKEEWERRKSYLIRSLFEDIPTLSPIYETREPTPSSPFDDIYKPESPLPDLIIEREPSKEQKYKQDESEEFYEKLAREMRKRYRKDFLQSNSDISTSVDASSNIEGDKHKDSFSTEISLESERSDQRESLEDEEYFSQLSREKVIQEESKSISSDRESNESEEICLSYKSIITKAEVHAALAEISEQNLPERIDRSEEEGSQSKSTKDSEISISLEENERVSLLKETKTGQDAEIDQEESKGLANLAEASQESSCLRSLDEYQLTPEIMRRRQTIFTKDSLSFHELPICESNDKNTNNTIGMEAEMIVASGIEMEIADDSLTDSNIIFTMTSTPKSSKNSRSRLFKRYKNRLVPYSSSSNESSNLQCHAALQTSFSDDEPDWTDIWKNFFTGTPTVYNICSCRNHICS